MTVPAPRTAHPPATLDEAVQRLRDHGGRLTPAKKHVLCLFFEAVGPLTAEELSARMPEVDEATVYRTLAQLERAGVVSHVHLGHGPASYELACRAAVSAF